jgi:ethanolamine utilization microcompartment shell protein EutL
MANLENVVHDTVDVEDSSTSVYGENAVGSFLLLQNVSDTDMYLSFTGAAVVGAGMYLRAGASLLMDTVVVDAPLTAIHNASGDTKTLLVTRA